MSGIHNYHFGYNRKYAENYDDIFRKKREAATDETSVEVQDSGIVQEGKKKHGTKIRKTKRKKK